MAIPIIDKDNKFQPNSPPNGTKDYCILRTKGNISNGLSTK